MKYNPEMYIDSGIYSDDEEVLNKTEKIVKCKKQHKCASCQEQIEIGEQALNEKAFVYGKPASTYTCLPCIEKWLEESGQVDIDDAED